MKLNCNVGSISNEQKIEFLKQVEKEVLSFKSSFIPIDHNKDDESFTWKDNDSFYILRYPNEKEINLTIRFNQIENTRWFILQEPRLDFNKVWFWLKRVLTYRKRDRILEKEWEKRLCNPLKSLFYEMYGSFPPPIVEAEYILPNGDLMIPFHCSIRHKNLSSGIIFEITKNSKKEIHLFRKSYLGDDQTGEKKELLSRQEVDKSEDIVTITKMGLVTAAMDLLEIAKNTSMPDELEHLYKIIDIV